MTSGKLTLLRFLIGMTAILALITLLPHGGAKDLSILGYKAFCPFSPFSTIITFYIALTLYRFLGNTKKKEHKPSIPGSIPR
jgi:uncharacterized BrkB/YihY/UPF0761 family membrane protein